MKIPFGTISITQKSKDLIKQILDSNRVSGGKYVRELEKKFAELIGTKEAIAVSSGTDADALALAVLYDFGAKRGDEIIIPALSFVSTGNAVLQAGFTPIFVDIDRKTLNIDPSKVEQVITDRTKAIMPVHLMGKPADMDAINGIAKRHNLFVIEDAAHAIDAKYKGRKIGNISDLTAFSFHPVKNMTTAEGGMVTTNNDELNDKLLIFRTHGISRDAVKRFGKEGGFYYDMQYLGFRYNLSELHSALGIHQLDKLESFQKRRREIVDIYNKELQLIEEITVPYVKGDIKHSWHLYVIQLELEKLKVDRDFIFKALREENIGVNVHYIPVHYHSYYINQFGLKKGILPNVESLFPRLITIPIFPKMSNEDVYDVINALEKVIKFYRK